MEKESDLNRRKFMETGIYTITGAIAALSSVALACFAVGTSFEKTRSKWIELDSEDVQDTEEGFARVVLEYEQKDGWLTATARSLAYVKRVKEDEMIAISASCSHLGCIVTWDQKAYWATNVGTSIMGTVPVVGEYALRLMRGGENLGALTMTRFYSLHVLFLPAATFIFLVGHFVMIRKQGIPKPL